VTLPGPPARPGPGMGAGQGPGVTAIPGRGTVRAHQAAGSTLQHQLVGVRRVRHDPAARRPIDRGSERNSREPAQPADPRHLGAKRANTRGHASRALPAAPAEMADRPAARHWCGAGRRGLRGHLGRRRRQRPPKPCRGRAGPLRRHHDRLHPKRDPALPGRARDHRRPGPAWCGRPCPVEARHPRFGRRLPSRAGRWRGCPRRWLVQQPAYYPGSGLCPRRHRHPAP
jgi:hypothetical protein